MSSLPLLSDLDGRDPHNPLNSLNPFSALMRPRCAWAHGDRSLLQYRHAYFLLCVAVATANKQERCYPNSTFADTASDRSALRT
jgi:hypothetical protein